MAEHGVFRHAPRQRRLERVNVIDALSGERAFAEQVLIDIRTRRRIGLDPTGAGKHPLVDRAFVTRKIENKPQQKPLKA